jgi:hypothetical protein
MEMSRCVVELISEIGMSHRPPIIFDTSGISGTGCLVDDPDLEALVAGLKSGFHTRITFANLAEFVSMTSKDRKRKVLNVCRQLLESGDCLDPPQRILHKMIACFEQSSQFDWTAIDVRCRWAEGALATNQNFGDEVAKRERESARADNKYFNKLHVDAKFAFDRRFEGKIETAPQNVSQMVAHQLERGPFWGLVTNLYAKSAKGAIDQETVRRFIANCPPIRVLMVSLCAALYDRCVRPLNVGPSLKSGRIDTFMAIYLPYCEYFVTNDFGQLECFKEVVAVCNLRARVRSYEEFRSSFLVAKAAAS